jgi:hypothetical protein
VKHFAQLEAADRPEAALVPKRALKALGSSKGLRHWMARRIPGTPEWWWDISKPATCAHQGAWMRCRKDEGFKVCSSLTRGEEEGIVSSCKKFHLCGWNWGNEEDRPEGLRARAYAYYVCINPGAVDELRRNLFSYGVGDKAVTAAAGNLINDLWEGDVDKFLKGVAIQRELRDRYLDMITDSVACPLPPGITSEDEEVSKGLEDLIPVGLEDGKPLTDEGRPVMTSDYLDRLDPLASEMMAPGRRSLFPWRKGKGGRRGEQASSSSRPAAPSRTPEESGEGRAGVDGSEREENASAAELPSEPDRDSDSEEKTPRPGGAWQIVKGRRVQVE